MRDSPRVGWSGFHRGRARRRPFARFGGALLSASGLAARCWDLRGWRGACSYGAGGARPGCSRPPASPGSPARRCGPMFGCGDAAGGVRVSLPGVRRGRAGRTSSAPDFRARVRRLVLRRALLRTTSAHLRTSAARCWPGRDARAPDVRRCAEGPDGQPLMAQSSAGAWGRPRVRRNRLHSPPASADRSRKSASAGVRQGPDPWCASHAVSPANGESPRRRRWDGVRGSRAPPGVRGRRCTLLRQASPGHGRPAAPGRPRRKVPPS